MGNELIPNLPADWKSLPLIECTTDNVISYGIVQPGQHSDSGIPIIRVNNFGNGQLDLSTVLKVTPEIESKFSRTRLVGGEVLLTLVGTTGQSIVAPAELAGWNVPRAVAVIRVDDEVGADWINICLQTEFTKHFLDSRANTTVQKTLNLADVKKIPIPIPPNNIREFIETNVTSLDKKIQLNRQTNETLKKMAQALFKSWFVDFDPVIDNALAAGNTIPDELQDRAERRQQQRAKPDHQPLPDAIRQLFPSEFELTEELGWVPMGWSVSSVGNVIENVGGGTPKTKEDAYWVGGIHAFCTPKDMSNMTSKILLNTERHLTKAGVLKISSGILPVGTVLMSSRAPIGYLAITDIPVSINQGIIALKQNEKYSSEYLLCWAESNLEEVVSRANGSTFLEISKKNFRDIPFLEPEGNVLPAFANLAHSYFERIASLQRQVDQLTKLRDTLLPKLISGELRLPPDASADAEQQLADATS